MYIELSWKFGGGAFQEQNKSEINLKSDITKLNNNIFSKPFVKWAGGKKQLLTQIESLIPSDFFQSSVTYIEPFVGGGAFLFYLLNKYPTIESAVINDINEDLITTYNIIKNKPLELISFLKQIQYEFYKLDEFEKQKEYFLNKRQRFNTKGLDDIENSAIFIFLNRTCFNGLYRVNSKGLFNVPFGKYTNPLICDEQTLLEDSKLLQKVEILNGDFSQTLDYLNNKTLFYLDPPYRPLTITSSFTSYSSERFDDNEQKRLCEFCNLINNNKQKFILSNSDPKNTNANDNFFDELYSNFNINRIYAKRAINSKGSKRGDISELLIDNFNSNFGEFYNA